MNPENPSHAFAAIDCKNTGPHLRLLVGANVRKMREARGMSQEALGYRVGADQAYVSRIETGAVSITIELVERLATVLNVPPAQFFDAGGE